MDGESMRFFSVLVFSGFSVLVFSGTATRNSKLETQNFHCVGILITTVVPSPGLLSKVSFQPCPVHMLLT